MLRGWRSVAGGRLALAGLLLLPGVAWLSNSSRTVAAGNAAATTATTAADPHEGLLAVLWVQRSAEYRAGALQAYRQATTNLARALADPDWTAALEQAEIDPQLPPAVIVDVDETVLDNSCYQARLIRDGDSYGPATWDPWVEEACAPPVPGALEFCLEAARQGATVFYVTNRRAHLRAATRRNLALWGFPLRADLETVLPRTDERDKSGRRAQVAATHRVLLQVGDNAADFSALFDSVEARARDAAVTTYQAWWGERWILLPNPMYGAWEAALVDGDYQRSPAELSRMKHAALRYAPIETARPRAAF